MGRPDKREAILDAARAVFGRVGYQLASIELIAAEAAVSTRTIYNHFATKEELFGTALAESTRQVAELHEAMIERHLTGVTDLEQALQALAADWRRPVPAFADHTAMSESMTAERRHVPREVYVAWREQGPWRVQRALAAKFAELHDQGVLAAPDARFAARLFSVMLGAGGDPGPAVRAFLYGFLPR